MNLLFSKSSLKTLESLALTKTLYAFDFDGTLAKIVPIPSDAYMTSRTETLLKELSKLVMVAVISGRGLKDLKQRIGFKPQFLIGNHGLEGIGRGVSSLKRAQVINKKWANFISKQKLGSSVVVENKTYSLALHYRHSRNKDIVKKKIESVISHLRPVPRVITGKAIFNLLPPHAPHKGGALLSLMQKTSTKHALFIGDDDTDEDVFKLSYTKGQLITVRVGQKKSSQAKFYIKKQSEINQLLLTLIRFHRSPARSS